ncbi:MAG: hypothetical protein H5T74_06000 [Actinobacteria bacterium]|nr:hypothetical protein [Actinomycetota bacterium]
MMLFKTVLRCTYLLLKAAFMAAALVNPDFRRRLAERDLSFAVRSGKGPAVGFFRLEGGRLTYGGEAGGLADFSATWNGWGDADTLGKKLRLNAMDFMNRGLMTFAGDLSAMDYLLVLLGEAAGSFRKKKPARLKRAELRKEPP